MRFGTDRCIRRLSRIENVVLSMIIQRFAQVLGFSVCLAIAGSASVLLGQEAARPSAPKAETKPKTPSVNEMVELTILDSNGERIPKAHIFVSCWFADRQYQDKFKKEVLADNNGVAKLELLPTLTRIRFWVSAEKHVTLFCGFEPGMLPHMPKEITLRLQPSGLIGGQVVDSKGVPIAGAKVQIRRDGGGTKLDQNEFSHLNTWVAYGDAAMTTDENGDWIADQRIPIGDDLEFSFIVKHPDFMGSDEWIPMTKSETTLDQLKNRSAKFRLSRGIRPEGKVVDEKGKPVPDALVIWGDHPYMQQGSQEIKTGAAGEFKLPAQPAEPLNITVVAKGWMPQMQKVDLANFQGPLKFELTKGKKIHLKFVDTEGNPVPGIYVSLMSWRGIQSLYNMQHPNVKSSQIPRMADENGEYVWDWAPDDAIQVRIGHPKLARFQVTDLTADNSTKTITVVPNFFFAGTLVDATTKQPIVGKYSITPLSCYPNGKAIAQNGSTARFDSPSFRIPYSPNSRQETSVKFEIEALNYRVKHSREFDANSPPFEGVIALEPAPPRTGQVVDQDGKPVSGASIFVCTKDNGAMIYELDDYFQTDERTYRTNEKGIFQYPVQPSRVAITVTSPNGYAERYLEVDESPGKVVLEPWATVQGQLFQAGEPVPGASIMARPIRTLGNDNPHLQDSFRTTTNSKGEYEFKELPPVPCVITSVLSPWRDFPISSNRSFSVRLKPGKLHNINLGGDGMQIVGKVKLAGESTDHIELRYALNYLVNVGSRIELEKHLIKPGGSQVGQKKDDWMKLTDNHGSTSGFDSHFVKLFPDGTFLINGVPPGDYRFLLRIYEPPSG